MRQAPLSIIIDPHGFVFDTDHTFRGLTISEKDGGWNIIIRGRSRAGAPVYAMTHSDDPQHGLDILWDALAAGNGHTLWRVDRFAS